MHNFDYSLNNSTTQQLEDPGFQPEVPKGPIYNSVQSLTATWNMTATWNKRVPWLKFA